MRDHLDKVHDGAAARNLAPDDVQAEAERPGIEPTVGDRCDVLQFVLFRFERVVL